MDVSIIIVNYNTRKLLIDCLASVKEKTVDLNYEIIVVDNASSDHSVKYTTRNFPNVKMVALEENIGFGKANNIGAQQAVGKYLFLLNSDTLLVNNAVKVLFDFMENKPNVGIAGGNLFTGEMKENFSYTTYLPNLKSHLLYRLYLSIFMSKDNFNKTGKNKKVGQIIGADLMISKDLFNKVGGFDPFYFMYVEDTDLQRTVTNLGYEIYSVPEAQIIHLQGVSSLTYQKLRWEIDGYKHYFEKFYDEKTFKKYLKIEKLSMQLRKLRYILTGNKQYVHVISQILKEL